MTTNVMIDLETLGATPGSVILSIGAVVFNDADADGGSYYVEINQLSCQLRGLTLDADTVNWWTQQDPETRKILQRTDGTGGIALESALYSFAAWLNDYAPDPLIWGNGADFDNVILEAAYRACGQPRPWKPRAGRCYRTLKKLAPHVPLVHTGTHHHALDDARSQAEHAVHLLRALNPWRPIEEAPAYVGSTVEVLAPAAHGLPDLITLATYHEDAGWCVDELREAEFWRYAL